MDFKEVIMNVVGRMIAIPLIIFSCITHGMDNTNNNPYIRANHQTYAGYVTQNYSQTSNAQQAYQHPAYATTNSFSLPVSSPVYHNPHNAQQPSYSAYAPYSAPYYPSAQQIIPTTSTSDYFTYQDENQYADMQTLGKQLEEEIASMPAVHYPQEQDNTYSTCTATRARSAKRTHTEAFNNEQLHSRNSLYYTTAHTQPTNYLVQYPASYNANITSAHTETSDYRSQPNVIPASLLTDDYVPYDNDELTAIQDLANQLETNTVPASKAARIEQVDSRTSVSAARVNSVVQNNLISSGHNATTSLRRAAPTSAMSENEKMTACTPYNDFFPMLKNNTAPADLFSILIKHSHFRLDALLRLASYAKKEMHPDGVQAMCAHLQTVQNEYPEYATKVISLLQQNDDIRREAYKDAALQKNLTPQAVAAYFKHPALTVTQRCAMIENGNYCKDMWHILANFYEKDALYAFLMKAREFFSDAQKLEIFDYLCKNPLNCTKNGVPDHEKNNLVTVQVLQKLFDGKSPEGRDPLHKLFPVEKLPAQAFEKLANTPENKEKLLAQGKTLFSRGTVLEIKEAITQGIPCHNPSQFLSARFNHRQSQIIKNHAANCNYDLSQTHCTGDNTHSTNQ